MENDMQIVCPECGTPVNTRFCGNCGFDTERCKLLCPDCGSIVPVTSKFCGECGRKFDGTEIAFTEEEKPKKQKEKDGVSAIKRFGAWIKRHTKAVVAVAVCVVVALAVSIPLGIYFSDDFRTGKVNKVELGMTREQAEEILGEPDSASNNYHTLYWMQDDVVEKYKEIQELLLTLDPEKWAEAERLTQKLSEKPFKSIMVRLDADKKVSEVFLDKKHIMGESDYSTVEKEVKEADLIAPEFIDTEDYTSGYYVKFKDGSLIKSYTNYKFDIFESNDDMIVLNVKWKDALGEYFTKRKCKIYLDIADGCLERCLCVKDVNDLTITIPNSVTSIREKAFCDCTEITAITIPNSVTNIGYCAFLNCTKLNNITVHDGNPSYHSSGNCLISTEKKILISGCNNSVIPTDGSVETIGYGAFGGCSGLKTITIPNSVTTIDGSAFSGCSGLTSITIPNSVMEIGEYAFADCTGLTSISIPNSVTSIAPRAFDGCSKLIQTENGVNYVDKWVIDCDTSVTSIYLRSNTVGIADSAFSGCEGLKSIVIPDGIMIIAAYAFGGCSGLTSITIPNSVTEIGDYAFRSCTGLTSITIPERFRGQINNAFKNCHNLTDIKYT